MGLSLAGTIFSFPVFHVLLDFCFLHASVCIFISLDWCCYRRTMSCVLYLVMSYDCAILEMQLIQHGNQLGMWYATLF
jgi:hypothetical protein